MTKYFTLIFTILVCTLSQAVAQANFKEGFIITNTNDTIYGEIDYGSFNKRYSSCKFKKDNAVVQYTPSQLAGYGFVNDRLFTSQVLDTAFVEVLVRGEMNLYRHKAQFFMQRAGGQVHKLASEFIRIERNGRVLDTKDEKWKGIVAYLIADCKQEIGDTKSLSLEEKSLTDLVIAFNQCKGGGFTVFKSNKP